MGGFCDRGARRQVGCVVRTNTFLHVILPCRIIVYNLGAHGAPYDPRAYLYLH